MYGYIRIDSDNARMTMPEVAITKLPDTPQEKIQKYEQKRARR